MNLQPTSLVTPTSLPYAPPQAGTLVWLRWLAFFTVVCTLALLAVGSLVTTLRVGMTDPVWPTYPWHLALISWEEPKAGYIIEHLHRLFGYIVGCCLIVLAVGLWLYAPRLETKILGVVGVLLVCIQGLLGGLRVVLDRWVGTDLAIFHGSFGQLVFASIAVLGLLTTTGWHSTALTHAWPSSARKLALVLLGVTFLQIVFGVVMRQMYQPLFPRLHLLFAFVIVGSIVWLNFVGKQERQTQPLLRVLTHTLLLLVAFQVVLGVETWFARYTSPTGLFVEGKPVSLKEGLLRTAHFVVGSLLFATSAVTAVQAHHPSRLTDGPRAEVPA